MKFAVALTLASTAMAGIVGRDATIIEGVISTIQSDIDAVKSAADAYNGDKSGLVSAADKLIADLKEGKSKVEGAPMLKLTDAAQLGGVVSGLAKSGTALSDALASRKSEVEKAGECKTVQEKISAITTGSKELTDAVNSKVPPAAAQIAQSLTDKVNAIINKASDDYKDCSDSGSGGSSTGTGKSTGTSKPTGSDSVPCNTVTGTGGVMPTSSHITIPTGAAAVYAPAGALAAVAAALAL